jgi:hypothetical protein
VQFDFEAEIESASVAAKIHHDAQKRSQWGRGLECGSMSMVNWSEMSRPVFEVLPRALEFVVSNR